MTDGAEEATITTTGAAQETSLLVDTQERQFGRYELGYEIASGGMATIFLARARGPGGFDRPFAIKRIHPHLAKQREFVDMFLDEARLQSRISHPNVCSVVDFGEVDGTYYMAMEYLLGRPLTAVVKAVVSRPELHHSLRWQALAARLIADACEGLHAAHELKDPEGRPLHLVHRDVTPHNLILTYEGALKVIDFGVAFAEGRAHETRTGAVKGKFAYMSPEQVRGREIDRRVDVWAIGVCLWELLTGRRLYGRRSDVELIHAIVNEPLAPPSSVVPISPALDAIVMRALERDLDKRTPNARALGRELSTFVAASGIPAGIVELAELMQELDGVERTKRLDVVAALMSQPATPENEPTQSGARRLPTATLMPALAATEAATGAPVTNAPTNALPAAPIPTVIVEPANLDVPSVQGSPFASAPASARHAEPALEVRLTRGQVQVAGLLAALALLLSIGLVWWVRHRESEPIAVSLSLPTHRPTEAPPSPTPAPAPMILPPAAEAPSAIEEPVAAPLEAASEEEERPMPVVRGTGTLNVAATGGWAEIFVDGEARGATPRSFSLPSGRHVVELRRSGASVARRTVNVRRNAVTRVVVPIETHP